MSNLDKEIKFLPVNIAIVSISDTRSLKEDFSGDFLSERIKGSGHHLIERHMVKDNKKLLNYKVVKDIYKKVLKYKKSWK